jgi:hypothetical protein
MEQEINIKLHIVFLNPQWKDKDSELQDELLNLFSEAIDYDVSYLESSCKDAYVEFTTSVDAKLSRQQIHSQIHSDIKKLLPWGAEVETIFLREEAEIYDNK